MSQSTTRRRSPKIPQWWRDKIEARRVALGIDKREVARRAGLQPSAYTAMMAGTSSYESDIASPARNAAAP